MRLFVVMNVCFTGLFIREHRRFVVSESNLKFIAIVEPTYCRSVCLRTWFVVLKCYKCVFAGCSVHPVVDSQFRRDVFVFFMDCLCLFW